MAAYDYSAVSAITASSIIPFGYWNNFIAFNASSFHAGITANSAIARTGSAVAFEHSARISGVHGMSANARPLGLAGIANQTFAGGSAASVITGSESFTDIVIPYAGSVTLGGGLFGLETVMHAGNRDIVHYLASMHANSAIVRCYLAGAGNITVTAYVLVHGA